MKRLLASNKEAVGSALRLLQYCQLTDRNYRDVEGYLEFFTVF